MRISVLGLAGIRVTALGFQAAFAVVEGTARAAVAVADGISAVGAAGVQTTAAPLRAAGQLLAGRASVATLTRGCWRGNDRAWIEVAGLTGPAGAEVGQAVQDALRDLPGVTAVQLNRSLSRVIVHTDGESPTLDELRAAVAAVDGAVGAADHGSQPTGLPGDGLLLAVQGAMVGISAAALTAAVVGRALRLPGAPTAVDAAAAIVNYQPWLRRMLVARIGTVAAETALSLVALGAHVVTLSPTALAVDLTMHALKAAEGRAGARAWDRYEPRLAGYASDQASDRNIEGPLSALCRPVPAPDGPAEQHGNRMALLQLIGAGVIGAVSGRISAAAEAATVTAPKGMRTTRGSFAATLGRGLAEHHAVLPLRPAALRRLDRVDALLIDPRVLCGPRLRVLRVRGVGDQQQHRDRAWNQAQLLLNNPGLQPGWHRIPRFATGGSAGKAAAEALILPVHDPMATALLTEARASGVALVSLDLDSLAELRTAFDVLHPCPGSVDDALHTALTDLQRAGRTVAAVSATAATTLRGADVALGVMPGTDSAVDSAADPAPPWDADLISADLAGIWRIVHALPAARTATQRGITLSAGASALGAVLMVPGIRMRRGRGPGPVTIGAAAGLLSGYLLARSVVRARAPRPAPAHPWHAMSVEQVQEVLSAPPQSAPTAVPVAQSSSAVWQFIKAVREELSDPLTPILAVGSAATAILGSPVDAVMVGIVLVGNAMLAAAQQLRAESRLNTLLAQQTPPARQVTAGGGAAPSYTEVAAELLQPGAVIEVRSNEVVPADARIIEATDLEVDESSLTGESLSVDKQTAATPGAELAERRCMLYAGTTVVAGTAVAVVTAVGAETQTRRAAELAAGNPPVVGLQQQLSRLMQRAFPVSLSGGVLVGLLGLLRHGTLRQSLGDAIGIAVAAVPEGMPLMATLAQYASARRLSSTGALVRVPRAVEALGRLDVVCFDKTGTLSENRLRVTRIHSVTGYRDDDVLRDAAHAAPRPRGDAHAHATDQAIIEAAVNAGVAADPATAAEPDAFLPFRSGRAFSAAVSGTELTVKGAPEVLLAACPAGDPTAQGAVEELAARGLRVIAVARRRLSAEQVQRIGEDPAAITEFCGGELSLTGFLGLSDTPRPTARKLLTDLTERGLGVRLITGDHPLTAVAIAAELGVAVTADQVITGLQWNALTRSEQERVVCERVIFARMSPENKVQIVQTLERAGQVCAMVGDGANDAAAIRVATAGIGVVARGSDSAHTIADVVLTDGRIDALVDAIDEGRRLWRGVQAAVTGLLGGNAGEVLFAVIGTALTGASPLNTRQLLLMNTLTDALPATAVAISTPAGPVHGAGRGLDENALWRAVGVRGVITATAATLAWLMAAVTGRPQRAATVALIALVSVELGQTLVDSHAPLVLGTAAGSLIAFMLMVNTPGISQLLGCTPVGPIGWAQALIPAAAATAAVAVATRLPAARRDPAAP